MPVSMNDGSVIAFISAPGVGKSFLTKQMACKNMAPGFFEGEAGIFPQSVLDVLNSEMDTEERYVWITSRLKMMLERAHAIARLGIDCYVDGDVLLVESWLRAEIGTKSPNFLQKWLADNVHLMAHKVIVLTATDEKIRENIQERNRATEQTEFIQERAFRIGQACLDLAEKYPHAKVVDRTQLDFTDSATLSMIDEVIQSLPPHQTLGTH